MASHKLPENTLNRRAFMGAGVAATLAGGAGLASSEELQSVEHGKDKQGRPLPFNPRTFDAMPTRNLGATGHRVGIFSLGAQAMVEREQTDLAVSIVEKAIDMGVNYIDTAPLYGDTKSESHVGMVMKKRRREVFLATKTHHRGYDDTMRLLDESLERLQTDHLDLLQLHNVQRPDELDEIFGKDGAMKALEKARDEGVARFLGITGHYDPQILAEGLNRYDFDTLLLAFNAADKHQESFIDDLLPVALAKNIGIIGMKVASRGRMLSCWTPPPLDQQPPHMVANRPGVLSMKEALFYNFSMPVSTNIVGCDSPKQVEENVGWAGEFTPYNEEVQEQLEERCREIVDQGLYFRKGIIGRREIPSPD